MIPETDPTEPARALNSQTRKKRHRAGRPAARRKVGMEPGSLVYVGEPREGEASITIVDVDQADFSVRQAVQASDTFTCRDSAPTSWIRVVGVHDTRTVGQIGSHFQIHALTIEDALNTNVRPRFEDVGEYLSVVAKTLAYDSESKLLTTRQVTVVWGRSWVISFEEGPDSIFAPIQDRIERLGQRQRMHQSDYLAYALLDLIVDQYYLAFEQLGDQIEDIEDSLVQGADRDRLADILDVKRALALIRRAVWPMRETIGMLERADSALIRAETRVYLRDLYEHSLVSLDTVESLRETVSGMLDIYLTSVSNRMNAVMKVLTIIATIFIPLGFLASVYGMNFDRAVSPFNMPELGWRYGYPLFWVLVALVGGGSLVWFWRKKWL
ncbi:MAG: magnesium/cobalt transporter CorA [candidate division Zixibacteria bacterium]|jgi:magnesium transporter|nr:magnesium/cobalt transporter CorA [candidate division Zixibacteria bacterium]